jgi:hypothetical protein
MAAENSGICNLLSRQCLYFCTSEQVLLY